MYFTDTTYLKLNIYKGLQCAFLFISSTTFLELLPKCGSMLFKWYFQFYRRRASYAPERKNILSLESYSVVHDCTY